MIWSLVILPAPVGISEENGEIFFCFVLKARSSWHLDLEICLYFQIKKIYCSNLPTYIWPPSRFTWCWCLISVCLLYIREEYISIIELDYYQCKPIYLRSKAERWRTSPPMWNLCLIYYLPFVLLSVDHHCIGALRWKQQRPTGAFPWEYCNLVTDGFQKQYKKTRHLYAIYD